MILKSEDFRVDQELHLANKVGEPLTDAKELYALSHRGH